MNVDSDSFIQIINAESDILAYVSQALNDGEYPHIIMGEVREMRAKYDDLFFNSFDNANDYLFASKILVELQNATQEYLFEHIGRN